MLFGTLGPENLHLAEVALRKLQPNAGFAGVALAKPRKYAVEMALAFRSRSKFALKSKEILKGILRNSEGNPTEIQRNSKGNLKGF